MGIDLRKLRRSPVVRQAPLQQDLQSKIDKFAIQVAHDLIIEMRADAPQSDASISKGLGIPSIRESIRATNESGGPFISFKGDDPKGLNRSFNLKVGPTAPHTKYVIYGTRPSPGRFDPRLGKRVPYGMHPGQDANPFIERNADKYTRIVEDAADEYIGAWIKKWQF